MKSKNSKPLKIKSASGGSDLRAKTLISKRQTHSNSSIFTKTGFVEKQYKFFSKFTISNCGDVENYFRNSLRNEPTCLPDFQKYKEPLTYIRSVESSSQSSKKSNDSQLFETPTPSLEKLEIIIMTSTNPPTPVPSITNAAAAAPASTGPASTKPPSPVPSTAAPAATKPPSPIPSTAAPAATKPPSPIPSTAAPAATKPPSPIPSTAAPAATKPPSLVPSATAPAATGSTSAVPASTNPPSPVPSAKGAASTGSASAVPASTDLEKAKKEDDELAEVEKMIAQAAEALDKAAEDIQQAEGDGQAGKEIGEGGSFFKFDPKIESEVLKELEAAEIQARETAKTINELKARIAELLRTDKQTTKEAKELEEKNRELKNQMVLFEEKTKRIQHLLGQTELFEKMLPPKTPLQVPHDEDILPRMVICGYSNDIPRFIMCDNKKRKSKPKLNETPRMCTPRIKFPSLPPSRPALRCDTTCRVNPPPQEGLCSPAVSATDANVKELENRLKSYTDTTQQLEKQLKDMEEEVKTMHKALNAVQAEREHLEAERSTSSCTCCVPPVCSAHTPLPPCRSCAPPCPPSPSPSSCPCQCLEKQISEITQSKYKDLQEKYCRLQDDYKSKLTEVACLRTENEKNKQRATEGQEGKKEAENKLRQIEKELKILKAEKGKLMGSKEQEVEMEQQLAVAKQRFRDAQDELEELRQLVEEQKNQIDEYRDKYLVAQQEVEEQKRKMVLVESDNAKAVEQVNYEMLRVKKQFEERLEELAPMPELLKSVQIKLQEVQQMHLLAEKNNEALSRELQLYKDKIAAATDRIENVKSDQELGEQEKKSLSAQITELQDALFEMENEKNALTMKLIEVESIAEENERLVCEKSHEIAQLLAQLEVVREESARQVARNKDRCETVRKSMQNQINELERQLAQTRALAKAAQQDRDEIRQKMQTQINNLQGNFEDAQMRIRNLQGHVNFLKSSYSNISGCGESAPSGKSGSCDQNNRDPCKCK